MASSRFTTREEGEEEDFPPPRTTTTTENNNNTASSSSSSSSLFLASLLQKSYVSCKKFQFSKRLHAVKNSIFARRLMTTTTFVVNEDDENEREENDEILLLAATLLGERFDLNDDDDNHGGKNNDGYERLKARVDSLFFATYVHDFPPIESKKMFLLRSKEDDEKEKKKKDGKYQTTTSTNDRNNNNSTFSLATMRAKSIDFVADKLGGYTTDCGWGCAPRSAQMLFGEALRRGRRRRRRRSGEGNETDEEKETRKEIVDMFTDDVDDEENKNGKAKNVFGLRRVYEGDEDDKTNALCPGQWLAPSEICKRYGKMMNALDSSSSSFKSVRVRCLVLGDGCGGGVPEFYPQRVRKEMEAHPDKDVLILVPLRCGASDTINPRYVKSLQKFLSARECVGIVGGKKSASYYIVGFTSKKNSSKTKSNKSSRSNDDSFSGNRAKEREEKGDDEEEESKAIYLDPHVAKAYESPRERYRDETTESAFYASFFGSASEHGILYTPFRALDPSLVVGFLVENDTNRDDDIMDERRAPFSSLNSFVDVLTKIERESGSTPLVTVVRKDDDAPSVLKKVSKKTTTSSVSVSGSKRTVETKKTAGDEEIDDWEIIDGPPGEEEGEEEEDEETDSL